MKNHYILVLLLLLLFYQCKSAGNLVKKNENKAMEVYLCIGQSNMAGRASVEDIDKDTLVNVFLFTRKENNLWEKAVNPFNRYSTVRKKLSMQRLSPSYSFAKTMSNAKPNTKIGLIVNAKGGTSIEEWKPGETLYNEAINQTKKALKTGAVLNGVIWHQGEANVSRYKKYLPKLVELIEALRLDLNQPSLPFIAGQLSEDKPNRKGFNDMLMNLPKTVSNTGVVSSENTSTTDQTHFDSASQRLIGERYAEEMLKLLNK
ncbi:sialate O-acetylesterase [Seonamhaeicola sp. MEBiC1930]|uniref:sialate O-acetylesterase n=1 Tax=Seonamhaeicola sp. MEBiC01930 TaxID=2976768 RepID=UPI00324C9A3E